VLEHEDGRAGGPLADAAVARRELLGLTALGGLALGAFGALRVEPAGAASSVSPEQDKRILNFALLLEYLQSSFYRAALERGVLRGEAREFAEVVRPQEQKHVDLLRRALGRDARRRPMLRFDEATRSERAFLRAAVVLEDAGVAAYNGQAANLTKPALDSALRIVSVEGRHSGWIRDLAGLHPAPFAADQGMSAAEVTSLLRRAGLLRS
jgi:Ferritin-like domain